jgi:Ca-activated chloride channel family protein
MQARKRRDAASWANPALMPNLIGARPGFRRHLPPLLLLGALAVMVVALARPQRTVAAPQRAATVEMVTDVSGSMNATDVQPSRLAAAVNAANRLTDKLPETYRLGLIAFSDFAEQRAAPTTDHGVVRDALGNLTAVGGTAMGLGLQRGLEAAQTPVPDETGTGTRKLPAVLVLLSDGKDTQGGISPLDVARQAKAAHIPIYAIALGTQDGEVEVQDSFGFTRQIRVPPDVGTLKEIARLSGGRFFAAADSGKLESIYTGLGTRLSSKEIKEEVTVAFAGGALLLLLVGSGLSMAWFGRPV